MFVQNFSALVGSHKCFVTHRITEDELTTLKRLRERYTNSAIRIGYNVLAGIVSMVTIWLLADVINLKRPVLTGFLLGALTAAVLSIQPLLTRRKFRRFVRQLVSSGALLPYSYELEQRTEALERTRPESASGFAITELLRRIQPAESEAVTTFFENERLPKVYRLIKDNSYGYTAMSDEVSHELKEHLAQLTRPVWESLLRVLNALRAENDARAKAAMES